MSEDWTIGRLLTWTTDFLQERGSDSARLDAEVLLAHARGCQRIELYTAFEEIAPEEVKAPFRSLVKRRASGEPVAYLVGQREFYSLPFEVNSDVLIPRPETEYVVLTLIDKIKQMPHPPQQIADVGTGSGILAICAARQVPEATVTAIDISPAALVVAKRNADKHQVSDRIEWVEGDLLSSVEESPKFDFILSNPPYIGEHELPDLDRDVIDHEPRSALVGGPQGEEIIARLIPQAAARLAPHGWFILELSPMIHERVLSLLNQSESFDQIETVKDMQRHARVIAARKKTG